MKTKEAPQRHKDKFPPDLRDLDPSMVMQLDRQLRAHTQELRESKTEQNVHSRWVP